MFAGAVLNSQANSMASLLGVSISAPLILSQNTTHLRCSLSTAKGTLAMSSESSDSSSVVHMTARLSSVISAPAHALAERRTVGPSATSTACRMEIIRRTRAGSRVGARPLQSSFGLVEAGFGAAKNHMSPAALDCSLQLGAVKPNKAALGGASREASGATSLQVPTGLAALIMDPSEDLGGDLAVCSHPISRAAASSETSYHISSVTRGLAHSCCIAGLQAKAMTGPQKAAPEAGAEHTAPVEMLYRVGWAAHSALAIGLSKDLPSEGRSQITLGRGLLASPSNMGPRLCAAAMAALQTLPSAQQMPERHLALSTRGALQREHGGLASTFGSRQPGAASAAAGLWGLLRSAATEDPSVHTHGLDVNLSDPLSLGTVSSRTRQSGGLPALHFGALRKGIPEVFGSLYGCSADGGVVHVAALEAVEAARVGPGLAVGRLPYQLLPCPRGAIENLVAKPLTWDGLTGDELVMQVNPFSGHSKPNIRLRSPKYRAGY